MPVFPVVAMQRFDFKNSSIAIKLSYLWLEICIYVIRNVIRYIALRN